MAESHFALSYDGPALETGRMPVRDLAPSLLALGDLFAEASHLLYPDTDPVGLSVRATEQGSFDVHLILEAHDLWDQLVNIFGSDEVTALANLQALLIGGTVGVVATIRKLKRRRIERVEAAPTPGQMKLTLDDGTTLEVPTEVARLVQEVSIRRKVRDVVAPLGKEGVYTVSFAPAPDRPPELVVQKDDLESYEFAALEEGDILLDEEREQVVQIASVSFEGKKWRLSDGNVTFWAAMDDAEFLAGVEDRIEQFAKGDLLRCRVRLIQTRRATGGLHSEYRVVRVIEHIRGATQLSIEESSTPESS
jgi:hypothetical protein